MKIKFQLGTTSNGVDKIREQELGVDRGPFRLGADGKPFCVGDTTGMTVLAIDDDDGPWEFDARGNVSKTISADESEEN